MLKGCKGGDSFAVTLLLILSLLSCGTGSQTSPETTDPASTVTPQLLLSDDFESGNFSKWPFLWTVTDVTINADPSHVRSGAYSAQMYYAICSTCEEAHQDRNRFLQAQFNATNGFPQGVTHIFVRGSVYFKRPEPGGAVDIQRKLYYIKSAGGPEGTPNAYWSIALSSDGLVTTPEKVQLYLVAANSDLGGTTTRLWTAGDSALLAFDHWYDIQVEVQANTPGVLNGRVALWIDGTKVFDQGSLDIRRDSDLGVNRVEVGSQSDRVDYRPVDEYRYWDNLKMSETYIQ